MIYWDHISPGTAPSQISLDCQLPTWEGKRKDNLMADFSSQFDRFTENAKRSLENAEQIATQMGSSYVGTEHILLGVLQQETSIGAKILKNVGVTFEKAQLVLSFSQQLAGGG